LVNDVYSKLRPAAVEANPLVIARVITVLVGLFGTLSAVFVTSLDPKSLWDLILLLVGLLGSTLAGVFLLGVLTRRANTTGTVVGVVASMVALIVVRNLPHSPVPGVLTSAVGVMTCAVIGYLASIVSRVSNETPANLTVHTLDVKEAIRE
jgi:Na+/proline symporter